MKKFILSLSVFIASAAYAAQQYVTGSSVANATTPLAPSSSTTVARAISPVSSDTPQKTTLVVTAHTPSPQPITATPKTPATTIPAIVKAPTVTPTPKPKGQYADGTYTGAAADAYYGMVQIRATIQGGKLVTVDFLQYPNDRRTSQYINADAMPLLKNEAIQAQSANVSGVSGASDTSQAFMQSLSDALAQAKNA